MLGRYIIHVVCRLWWKVEGTTQSMRDWERVDLLPSLIASPIEQLLPSSSSFVQFNSVDRGPLPVPPQDSVLGSHHLH